jgi:hypothetical protein
LLILAQIPEKAKPCCPFRDGSALKYQKKVTRRWKTLPE